MLYYSKTTSAFSAVKGYPIFFGAGEAEGGVEEKWRLSVTLLPVQVDSLTATELVHAEPSARGTTCTIPYNKTSVQRTESIVSC